MIIDHLPGRTITLNNEEHLFFSGTSYLGMGHQPLFREALMEGMSRYGTVFSASRNNNLKLKIYEEAEDFLAQWTGAEAALTVTSGLLAGQISVQSIDNQRFIYAPSVHPAIWRETPPSRNNRDFVPQQYFFENYDDFSSRIIDVIENEKEKPVVVCTNTIDPLRCEIYDFLWIAQLPQNQDITLVFDDSHGIGITGNDGAGFLSRPDIKPLMEQIKLLPRIKVIVIASLAKALGIPGGVILSDVKTIEAIRRNPLFVGASPIVPAYLFAFLKAQNVYQQARERVFFNINLYKNLTQKNLKKRGNLPTGQAGTAGVLLKTYDNYPVSYMLDNSLYDFLLKHKVLISSFSYPNPSDAPITRIIISALHEASDIEYLASVTNDFLIGN
jgi:8-amino-7-oxononanoate synthase